MCGACLCVFVCVCLCVVQGIMSERCTGVADMAEECPEEFVENPRAGESFLQPMQVCVCMCVMCLHDTCALEITVKTLYLTFHI